MTSARGGGRWVLAVLAVGVGYWAARRASLRWGAQADEVAAELPGDDLIDAPDLEATRAITVRATPDEVWPWVAQLGEGRGGFYSYDALENLIGLDIHSAEQIVPELQGIAVGDTVRLAPQVGLTVRVAVPGEALVIQGAVPAGESAPVPYDFVWAFVLRPGPAGTTRLVIRERYVYRQAWARPMVEAVEWLSFLMTERMLRGIRDRAERTTLTR